MAKEFISPLVVEPSVDKIIEVKVQPLENTGKAETYSGTWDGQNIRIVNGDKEQIVLNTMCEWRALIGG